MTKAKFEKITYSVFDYRDFEQMVNKHYKPKVKYDFVSDAEVGNDSCQSHYVVKDKMDGWDKQHMEELKHGEGCYHINYILQDLVNRDILEEGHYLIEVCW